MNWNSAPTTGLTGSKATEGAAPKMDASGGDDATAKSIGELFDENCDETYGAAGAGVGGVYVLCILVELTKWVPR